MKDGVPTVVFGGEEYGTGSSRDWAAKGTQLLGVKAVIAKSFERIHRSNLVGMGVLPLQFMPGEGIETFGIRGDEMFDIEIEGALRPQMNLMLLVFGKDGEKQIPVRLRIDTPIEVEYYKHGGILPYVLRQLLAARAGRRGSCRVRRASEAARPARAGGRPGRRRACAPARSRVIPSSGVRMPCPHERRSA
jgi:aconitate hydratase